MKKAGFIFLSLIIAIFFLQIIATPSDAYVSVGGYYRSNGTYVRPHVRSNPNGIRYDNYGYKGGSSYNNSYYNYNRSNSWRTPSYNTDPYYYQGKSLYNSYNYGY